MDVMCLEILLKLTLQKHEQTNNDNEMITNSTNYDSDDTNSYNKSLVITTSSTSNSTLDKHLEAEIAKCRSYWKEMSNDLEKEAEIQEIGRGFYSFITPFIICVGLLGNSLSIAVFSMKHMRKLNTSIYLGALAVSDNIVLGSYALFEWLYKGLGWWSGSGNGYSINLIGMHGFCHAYLFVSYTFRFFSAYLIVVFTLERYVGICWPLRRRSICTNAFARRSICGLLLFSVSFSIYKPVLSTVHQTDTTNICGSIAAFERVNFIMDLIYGVLITGVSVIMISIMNIFIARTFWKTRKRHIKAGFHKDDNNLIKIQFTVIIWLVSTTFVVLNTPYFIMWCLSYTTNFKKGLEISKTIFLCNYASNFFLYSITGAYFRKQLRRRLGCCSCLCKKLMLRRGLKEGESETMQTDANFKEQSVVLTRCTLVHIDRMNGSDDTPLYNGIHMAKLAKTATL